jgi:hypothetical protein
MKSRSLIFFLTVLLIALFSGCSQKEDSIVNSDSSDLMKGKPQKPKIEYFQLVVNGERVYDIGKDLLPVIDFTSPDSHYTLKYKISHPDPNFSTNLRFWIHYEPSGINHTGPWFVCGGDVVNKMVTPGEYIDDWNGNAIREECPPVYQDNPEVWPIYLTTEWEFMDQKASYPEDPDQIIADRYYFSFWGDFENRPNSGYMTIKTNKGPDGEMYVESISIIRKKINNKKYAPLVKIVLKMNNGVDCPNAQIQWGWGGNIIGCDCTYGFRMSNENGIITLEGPSYSSSSTGNIIFTVKTIGKKNCVYNPYNNTTLGTWPVEPYGELIVQ